MLTQRLKDFAVAHGRLVYLLPGLYLKLALEVLEERLLHPWMRERTLYLLYFLVEKDEEMAFPA
jgi:hypothetical protein